LCFQDDKKNLRGRLVGKKFLVLGNHRLRNLISHVWHAFENNNILGKRCFPGMFLESFPQKLSHEVSQF